MPDRAAPRFLPRRIDPHRGRWLRGMPLAILASLGAVAALTRSALADLPATISHGVHASTLLGGHADLVRVDPFGLGPI
ncbi:MAG: hypothetical protein V9G19_13585 [Tetrasphaera sp.]